MTKAMTGGLPVRLIRGDVPELAPVVTADGGIGFSSSDGASAWSVMAGQGQTLTELGEYLRQLEDEPDLRAAATLRSLSRVRTELERLPESAQLGDPVVLHLRDVALLARQLLSRLR